MQFQFSLPESTIKNAHFIVGFFDELHFCIDLKWETAKAGESLITATLVCFILLFDGYHSHEAYGIVTVVSKDFAKIHESIAMVGRCIVLCLLVMITFSFGSVKASIQAQTTDILLLDRDGEPIKNAQLEIFKGDVSVGNKYALTNSSSGTVTVDALGEGAFTASLIVGDNVYTEQFQLSGNLGVEQTADSVENTLLERPSQLSNLAVIQFDGYSQGMSILRKIAIVAVGAVIIGLLVSRFKLLKLLRPYVRSSRWKAIGLIFVHRLGFVVLALFILVPSFSFFVESARASAQFSTLRQRSRTFANTVAKPASSQEVKSCTNANNMRDSYSLIHGMARKYITLSDETEMNNYLSNIRSSLEWMRNNCYRSGYSKYNNWYINQVNVPFSITSTLLLVPEIGNTAQYATDAYFWSSSQYASHDSANMTVVAKNMLAASILLEDTSKINQLFKGPSSLTERLLPLKNSNGFMQDGSFDFHSVMHTDYGSVLLDDLGRMLTIVRGTEFDFTVETYNDLYTKIFQAFEGVMFDKQFMEFSRGRAMTVKYGNEQGDWFFGSLKLLRLSAPEVYRKRIDAWLKQVNEISDANVDARQDVDRFMSYNEQSKSVLFRDDYAIGLAMSSAWARAFEGQNSQNLQGWYLSEGRIETHTRKDKDQYNDFWWPTIDRKRLPGTTVLNKPLADLQCDPTANPKVKNAGSAQLKEFGIASFKQDVYIAEGARAKTDPEFTATCGIAKTDRVKLDIDLKSNKSYFFFDDEIVLLGTGIQSLDNDFPVETTIENRKIKSKSLTELVIDNVSAEQEYNKTYTTKGTSWMHASYEGGFRMGYYFLMPSNINYKTESRKGSWSEVTAMTPDRTPDDPTRTVERSYFTSWLDHGRKPLDEQYGYVMLPNYDKYQTEKYNNEPDVKILSKTNEVHHVFDKSTKLNGLVFWKAGSSQGVESDRMINVIYSHKDSELNIAVTNPDLTPGANQKVRLKFPYKVSSINTKDSTITVENLNPLTISVDLSTSTATNSPRGKTWNMTVTTVDEDSSSDTGDNSFDDEDDTDENDDQQNQDNNNLDKVSPNIQIMSPVEGTIVSGVFRVEYSASDNQKLAKADIEINGVKIAQSPSATNVEIDSKNYADGPISISIMVFDEAGNSSKQTTEYYVKNKTITKPSEPVLLKNNLALNYSFESEPREYFTVSGTGSKLQWSDKEFRSGKRSLEIYSNNSGSSLNDQRWLSNTTSLKATPGKSYSGEVWVKTSNISGSVRARINFWNKDIVYINPTTTSQSLNGTVNWTKLVIPAVQAPQQASFMRIEILQAGSGWTWIDDVRICENGCVGEVDEIAPTVTMSQSRVRYLSPYILNLEATATDNGQVVRVDYYVNDSFICSSTDLGKGCSWQLTALYLNDDYNLTAKAFDANGNSATSQLYKLKVRQPDLNRDGRINVVDLSKLLSNWGKALDKQHDLNDNGKVDIQDLSILLSNWRSQ